MTRLHHSLRVVAATFLLAGAAAAQNFDGPYWTEYPNPTAGISQFRTIGETGLIQTPVGYHFYSGITRKWTQLATTGTTTFQIANKYAIVQSGTTFHAFCSRTGEVATLTANAGATLQFGSANASWACYVLDGNRVHGFTAFFGQWVTLNLSAPPTAVSLSPHAVVAVDGTTAYGLSTYYGNWVAEPVRAGGTYTPNNAGVLGVWAAPDEVKGFSAYQNTWASAAFAGAPTAQIVNQEGYALLSSGAGADVLAFSTMRGSFQQLTLGPGTTLLTGPNSAILAGINATFGYAPGVDGFVLLPFLTLALPLAVSQSRFGAFAMMDTGTSLVAFSGLDGSVSTCPAYAASATFSLGDTAGYASFPGGGGYAYSALTNDWTPAPTNAPVVVTPMFETVMLTSPTDYHAFSARKNAWHSIPSNGTLQANTQAALAFVIGANDVKAYDPVLGRWQPQATTAAPIASTNRLTGLVHDGTTGYGYSLFSNVWDSIPLQGAVTAASASSSLASIRTTTHVYMFTANGSMSNFSRFPEFSRFLVRGGVYGSLQAAEPGCLIAQGIGTEVELPSPFGTLRVDLNTADVRFLGFVPASGVLRTLYTIPNDPAFVGVPIAFQDAVFTPQGSVYLTNGQVPYIW